MAELAQTVSFSRAAVSQAPGKRPVWQTAVLIALILWIYAPVLWRLFQQWWTDPNFSHGFFVPAFSMFVVWQKRKELQGNLPAPSSWGLPLILFSLFTLILGVFGAELFLSRISLILLLTGLVIFLRGWKTLRTVLFPLAFLVLMVPIPSIIRTQITFPLQT